MATPRCAQTSASTERMASRSAEVRNAARTHLRYRTNGDTGDTGGQRVKHNIEGKNHGKMRGSQMILDDFR